MQKYDVIVVGGGPAGSTTATQLARQGLNVVVLEREQFPREHVGESLLPFTYNLLEDLGVLDQMKSRFSRKPGVTFSNIDGTQQSHWCFNKVIDGPEGLSFHVRRAEFDDILLRNSEKHGAQVIEQARVTHMDVESGEVTYTDKTGNSTQIQARFVVDASGQGAVLARQQNIQKPFKRLNVRQAISTHWQNVNYNPSLAQKNIEIVHLGGEKLGWIWLIPLVDCLSIGVALNMDYAKRQRQKLISEGAENWAEALYMQELESSPEVARIIHGAERMHEVNLNGDFSYYAQQKFGPKHAIVGDASAFLDPIFSSGIYLAMKGAVEIAEGIEYALKFESTKGLQKAYDQLAGGYKVVEELICTFYDDEAIKFEEIPGKERFSFAHFESAYAILHLILAGDFFANAEKYLDAIARLKKGKNLSKYMTLTGHGSLRELTQLCNLPAPQAS